MFETSKDVLYLVISFCIVWLTVFLCWMFYYVVRILKNANEIVEELRTKVQMVLDAVNYIQGKVEDISGILTMASGGVSGFVKKMVTKKAGEWIDKGSNQANKAAKDAVDKAVEETTKKMKSVTKKMRK